MEDKLIIRGAKPLSGTIPIRGSKNTVLPLIAASLLTNEEVELNNVPEISDVSKMLELAGGVGAEIKWDKEARRIIIQARNLSSDTLDAGLARKLRASILFAGPLFARLRKVCLPYPGGDAIGARPLATHFQAFADLGAKVEEGDCFRITAQAPRANRVVLEETSVTATENAIMAAVLLDGKTTIQFAAREPHVQELVKFLCSMGAEIKWLESPDLLEIKGVKKLSGTKWRINPDEIEVSGFSVLAAATRSELLLEDIESNYLDAVFLQLRKMQVPFELEGRNLKIKKPKGVLKSFRVQSGLYPKLGSDHLPPFAVLATQAEGASLIHDWLYEGRMKYVEELQKMGANAMILDPHRALILGPTPLYGREITSLDIRSGMTVLIAALVAEGESVISGVGHLDRGYERLEERSQAVGADIHRIRENSKF